MSKNPLGKSATYPSAYSPDLLFAIPRENARNVLGLDSALPFSGVDLWNAWELTWLDDTGKPAVATAEIRVPAESVSIIESKSMKLYLGSLAMTRYADEGEVTRTIGADLSKTAGAPVSVDLLAASDWHEKQFGRMPGKCIDHSPVVAATDGVDANLLSANQESVELQELHSHLLYSNCPVTNQPDSGSILIRYSGAGINEGDLLSYLVSYRQHNDFHEACIERIFVDIIDQCAPEKLTVYARYNRRGGLDINPFRSNFESAFENLRLWRQ
jgi:7-cyano-7-deazaguanine reductase